VKPAGSGDEKSFHATIDASPGWVNTTGIGPAPGIRRLLARLPFRDDYELVKGDGVVFYWADRSTPSWSAGTLSRSAAKKGIVTLEAPRDAEIRIDEMPVQRGGNQKRIGIHRSAPKGRMDVTVVLKAL